MIIKYLRLAVSSVSRATLARMSWRSLLITPGNEQTYQYEDLLLFIALLLLMLLIYYYILVSNDGL